VIISRSVLLRMRNVSDKSCREDQNTFYVQKRFPENSEICEIMWENEVDPNRPQTTIWHTRIACWIPKATNTHSQYVILIAFPQQQWLHDPRMLNLGESPFICNYITAISKSFLQLQLLNDFIT
jgi:hypothetical protein